MCDNGIDMFLRLVEHVLVSQKMVNLQLIDFSNFQAV